MTSHNCDVAIVGAGPTGMTLANVLGQAGCRVIVIERNEHTVREPRAVSIDDESLRTMQAIGLSEAVVPDVALDYGSHYFTKSGTCFAKVEPTTNEYGFPRRNAFTQPKLEEALLRGLSRFPSVELLFSHELVSFEEGDAVVLKVKNVAGVFELRSRYLVGCDGARSAVRKRLGSTLTGSSYRQPWLIVDLASTREQLRQTRVVCNPARPFITLPGPNGIRRYEFMLHPGEDVSKAVEPEFVRELLARNGPDADMPIVRRQVYTFHARVADRWRRGPVLLAGDAAHLSPPFAGQGMNSGIRDAHNLGWKLAAIIKGELGDGVLDTYQKEREPHARALIELAINMGRIMMPTSPLQAWLVQAAFRLAGLAPRVQSYFAQMKYKPKPFYREGFVVRGRGAGSLVGRMLAQPVVERHDRNRVKLDDLLGDGFSLVAYGADAQSAIAAAADLDFGIGVPVRLAIMPQTLNPCLERSHVSATVRDVAGLFAAYVPEGRTVVLLVRPDRYICAAAFAGERGQLANDVHELVARSGWVNEGGKSPVANAA